MLPVRNRPNCAGSEWRAERRTLTRSACVTIRVPGPPPSLAVPPQGDGGGFADFLNLTSGLVRCLSVGHSLIGKHRLIEKHGLIGKQTAGSVRRWPTAGEGMLDE
jgi:hypothetical protein